MVIESKRKAVSRVCGLNALCLKASTSIIPALLSADEVRAAATTTKCLRALVALILVHFDDDEAGVLALLVLLEGEEGTHPRCTLEKASACARTHIVCISDEDRHEDRQKDRLAGNITGKQTEIQVDKTHARHIHTLSGSLESLLDVLWDIQLPRACIKLSPTPPCSLTKSFTSVASCSFKASELVSELSRNSSKNAPAPRNKGGPLQVMRAHTLSAPSSLTDQLVCGTCHKQWGAFVLITCSRPGSLWLSLALPVSAALPPLALSLPLSQSLTLAAEKEGSHGDERGIHFKSPLLGIKSEVKL
jgi:hypothetical protein